MNEKIQEIVKIARQKVGQTENLADFNKLWLEYFGSSGIFTREVKKVAQLTPQDRPQAGKLINLSKKKLEDLFNLKKTALLKKADAFSIDVTLPGIKPAVGFLHPQTLVLNDLIDIFKYLGYQAAEGPEIETAWYNFISLNFPPDHPAMDSQQSLRVPPDKSGKTILRTQTSAMQVRVLEKSKLPLRVIVPGKCYRYEAVDASHGFEFWQLEGFAVDRNIRLTDLFGTIEFVIKKLMGDKTKLRFACTNFPFVEPGVDTYIECSVCHGNGCPFCKQSGWSEIMPAGMIHPNVLSSAKIDPQKWQGFAFAIGLSRAVTLRYGIDDLRVLTNPDLRILSQF